MRTSVAQTSGRPARGSLDGRQRDELFPSGVVSTEDLCGGMAPAWDRLGDQLLPAPAPLTLIVIRQALGPGATLARMAEKIDIGSIHHLRLTVTDIARSREFYTGLLGFDVAAESPAPDDPAAAATYPVLWGGIVMAKGDLLLGLRPVAPEGDRFDEDRVGLDHLSFNVPDRASLEAAARLLESRGVAHGEIRDLPGFGIAVLPFRDPDNIQIEITSPLA